MQPVMTPEQQVQHLNAQVNELKAGLDKVARQMRIINSDFVTLMESHNRLLEALLNSSGVQLDDQTRSELSAAHIAVVR